MSEKKLKILLIGAQASGKGTQAARLAARFNIPHISTGNIFREEIKNGSELGLKAKAYTEKGLLVPDDIPNQIIASRLTAAVNSSGFVLEGYPRNLVQARFLESAAPLDYVFEILISDQEALKRISGRRTCPVCQKVYNVFTNPPQMQNICDVDGAELIIRDDEKEAVVKVRLNLYHQETEPILRYYQDKKTLFTINGEQPIDHVFADIIKVMSS